MLFFEEPLPIDDVEGHAFLADKLDVRIATGENMYTRWDFMPFSHGRRDPRRAGRRLPLRRHQRGEADRRHRRRASTCHAVPHTFSDALTIVANLHVVAAATNAPIMEYDRTYNPLQEELVTNPPAVHDSVIELPTGPGLGVEIDWDFVADHPWSGRDRHRRSAPGPRSGWLPRPSPTAPPRRSRELGSSGSSLA